MPSDPDKRLSLVTEQELEELRREVQQLREEQERLKQSSTNGQKDAGPDGHPDGHPEEQKNGGKEGQDGQGQEGQQEEQKQGKAEGGDKEKEQQKEKEKPHPLRKWLIIGGVVVAAIVLLLWWLHARRFEDTDDAYIEAHISGLASRISGTVTGVYVEEDQPVNPGQVIVDLDPNDSLTAVQTARSQLRQAQQQRIAEQPNIPVTETTNQTEISVSSSQVAQAQQSVTAAQHDYQAALDRLTESEANNAKAQADVERYRPLVEKDEVSKEQFDQVTATAKALAATVAADQQSAQAASAQLEESRDQMAQAQQRAAQISSNAPHNLAIRRADVSARDAAVAGAQAQLDQALLNLSYCHIVTPVGGIVAKRIAEVGQDVAPGQQVALISEVNDLWVTANFRETQLRLMRPGESVRIHVDTFDRDFWGYVEDMPAASGSVTSILPPENATGNFVKIVQRLPVRIRFSQGQQGIELLRPGMSVEPRVEVR